MSGKEYLTPEGLSRFKIELADLKKRGRSDIAGEISEARDKGDLKENAEYKAAKEAQGLLELRISKLENKVANAVIVDTKNMDLSKVYILSIVKVKNLKTNQVNTFQLVPESETNVKESKISVESPVGKGLIGRKVGDKAKIQVPAGKLEFEILEISLD